MPNGSLGTIRANLLVEFDNEKGFEFRVQCEAPIADTETGLQLAKLLSMRTPSALREAKTIALKNLKKDATKDFKQIVTMAFDENIAHLTTPGDTAVARAPKRDTKTR